MPVLGLKWQHKYCLFAVNSIDVGPEINWGSGVPSLCVKGLGFEPRLLIVPGASPRVAHVVPKQHPCWSIELAGLMASDIRSTLLSIRELPFHPQNKSIDVEMIASPTAWLVSGITEQLSHTFPSLSEFKISPPPRGKSTEIRAMNPLFLVLLLLRAHINCQATSF